MSLTKDELKTIKKLGKKLKLKDYNTFFVGIDNRVFLLLPVIFLGFYRDSFTYYFGLNVRFLVFQFRVGIALAFNWEEVKRFNDL